MNTIGEIRPYTEEELKKVKIPNPFDIPTPMLVRKAHDVLHFAIRTDNPRRALKSWEFLAVVREHLRIVKKLIELNYVHRVEDELDKTLPVKYQKLFFHRYKTERALKNYIKLLEKQIEEIEAYIEKVKDRLKAIEKAKKRIKKLEKQNSDGTKAQRKILKNQNK